MNFTQVTWILPKPLYEDLQTMQESLRAPDGTITWPTVEAMAVHFLTVAMRQAQQELARKRLSERRVQLVPVMPRALP